MSNQWGRTQRNRPSIVKGIAFFLSVSILAYLSFPGLKNMIYPLLKPTYAATNSSNYTLPKTNNSLTQSSPPDSILTYPIQDSLSTYNLANETKNNEVTTGFWLLFVANGQISQLSVDAETIAFIQLLINKDLRSSGKNNLVLVENGRFRQYMISDEINSVVASLSVIDIRASKGSINSSPNSSALIIPNSTANSSLNAFENSNLNGSGNLTNPNTSTQESTDTFENNPSSSLSENSAQK
ncbi:hypothetical protein AT727_19110 [Desulfitobacterium hafniense]|uniref:Uncharacterized protein n=1 Tax=Desulfitobacterium hafniense TaxID=49338 RepID=A0A0W1JLM1_DESHA|nr:hypothetical protein [Desulfitobacterium hafniense]KTE92464.1 hypothetical protein AT727_19110 [Desulfitobacterium hafniense]